MTTSDNFWELIDAQIAELEKAKTVDGALTILSSERNPYGPDWDGMDGGADGFFAGSGGDATVLDALAEAGWRLVWSEAIYYWVMEAPEGEPDEDRLLTYIEGDIYRGNKTGKEIQDADA